MYPLLGGSTVFNLMYTDLVIVHDIIITIIYYCLKCALAMFCNIISFQVVFVQNKNETCWIYDWIFDDDKKIMAIIVQNIPYDTFCTL